MSAGPRVRVAAIQAHPTSVGRVLGLSAATWAVIAIVLLGLALRIVWVLRVNPVPFGDSYWYFNVATNLIHGKGFAANPHSLWEPAGVPKPTAYYPPLYPFALAGLWKAIGFSLTSGKLLNAAFDTLTIVLVYDICRRVFGRRAGVAAAAVYALLPNAIAWLPLLLSEALFTFLFTAGLWVLIASPPWAKARRAAATPVALGFLAGLAILTRGVAAVLPAAALVFWLRRDGRRAAWRQLALALAAMMLMILPWTARNWITMGTPIIVSSNTGYNLRIGHSPEANGTFALLSDPVGGVDGWRSIEQPDWEVRAYRVYTVRAIGYAFTHPSRELELAKSKVYYLYRSDAEIAPALTAWGAPPFEPRGIEDVLTPLATATWFLLLFAALTSAVFWFRGTPERLLLAAVLVWWTAFHVLFFGLARYHLGLLPITAVLAAGGLAEACAAARLRLRHVGTSS